jgi:YHS domain-containing protein
MKKLVFSISIVTLCLAGCTTTADHSVQMHTSAAMAYPLKTCIVTDEDLDKDAYVFTYKGQEIKLCCEACKEDFNKNPSKYLKKIAKK